MTQTVQDPEAVPDGWQRDIAELRLRHTHLFQSLQQVRTDLLRRVRAEVPSLLPRIELQPPRPRGYQIVPAVEDDTPPASIEPIETKYSLAELRRRFERAGRTAVRLDTKIVDLKAPLASLVQEFERVRDELRNLDEHLAYHAYWQQAVRDYPEYFAARNRDIAWFKELRGQRIPGSGTAVDGVWADTLHKRLHTFAPTAGLKLESWIDDRWVLPVTVYTDIVDETFLSVFKEAIEMAFTHSNAARALRFEVALRLERLAPDSLYPYGAPFGAAIDTDAHVARFPSDALVLTTGAESTHAWTGKYIVLGPKPTTRRTLAHEFAHLLGFKDVYLRGFEGEPEDSEGLVVVEWTGLTEDLMGNPSSGQVTTRMIQTLMDAYRERSRG